MNQQLKVLVCATIVATQWGFAANAQLGSEASGVSRAVYTMTNDASENSILVYSRNANGRRLFKGLFRPTAGVREEFSTRSNRRGHWYSAKMVHFSLLLTRAAEPLAHFGSRRYGLDFIGEVHLWRRGANQHRHPRRSALYTEYRGYYRFSHPAQRDTQGGSIIHSVFSNGWGERSRRFRHRF